MKNKNVSDKKALFFIVLAFVFLASIGLSYAYFTLTITGNEEANMIKASTGTLSILYSDGPEIIANGIQPGWSASKTFTVKNTGSLSTSYSIRFIDVINTIENDELRISYYSVDGGTSSLDFAACTSDCITSQNIMIGVGETHTYTVKLEFVEKNSNQNYNQNKSFSAVINVISGNDEEVVSYSSLESILIESAKTYVTENNINENTYIPVNTLNITFNDYDYFTNSTGVEVNFENGNPTYTPYISTSFGRNVYANSYRSVSSNVILLGASPYVINGNFEEPGYIADDDYVIVAKDTQLLSDGKNILKYNIYKDNKFVDTINRIVYKDTESTNSSVSCDGEITNNSTILTISTTNGISSYDVVSNNIIDGTGTTSTYTINAASTNVYINIEDSSGNSMQKQCYIIDSAKPLQVHMIDVGGGGEDSLYIKNNKSNILIDGGAYENGMDQTLNYLNALGVSNIGLVIGSHLDYNHVQAHAGVLSNFGVKNVMYNSNIRTCVSDDYCNSTATDYIVDKLDELSITPLIMEDGDELGFNGFRIKCISPKVFYKMSDYSYADNKNSLNFILSYKNKKFLFTGDSIESDNILSEYNADILNIDFLKHPHHGNVNIDSNFLDSLSPDIDFVSADVDYITTYFPSVKAKLDDLGTSIYYTYRSGNIVAVSDGDTINVDENAYPSFYNDTIEHSTTIKTASTFVNNYNTYGLTNITHASTVSQAYETTEYRFQGKNPNNYILFNNNEVWRILGVFEVEDGTGSASKEYRIKLIYSDSYGFVEPFDTAGGNSYATASINTLLNSGDYYNKANSYQYKGLSTKAKSQIGNTLLYLSGFYLNTKTPSEMYTYERSNIIDGTNATTTIAKVGIMYASDYGYANSLCSNLNIDKSSIGNENCRNNNWLYEGYYNYTLTPYSDGSTHLFGVRTSGHLSYTTTNGGSTYIKPTVYLNSNIQLKGSGTISDPYVIQ